MVLDGVVGSAWDHFGHVGPLVPEGSVRQKQYPLLIAGPLHFEDVWVEMVVPALPTLLA